WRRLLEPVWPAVGPLRRQALAVVGALAWRETRREVARRVDVGGRKLAAGSRHCRSGCRAPVPLRRRWPSQQLSYAQRCRQPTPPAVCRLRAAPPPIVPARQSARVHLIIRWVLARRRPECQWRWL